MTKQIEIHQITSRIEQLIDTQVEKNYKAGRVYHQMDKMVQKNWKHLCHAYNADGLASQAMHIAKGEMTITELVEILQDSREIWLEMEKMYG